MLDIKVVPETEFAAIAAEIVRSTIVERDRLGRETNICLPTGETPKRVYEQLVQMADSQELAFLHVHAFTLDEWGELPPQHPIRCISRLQNSLLDPVGIPLDHVHFLEPNAPDVGLMCAQYDDTIRLAGGLHLSVLGIGMNGHVGFNEPGSTPYSRTRVVELDGVTLEVSKRYQLAKTPSWGVTVGLATLLESHQVLILANGSHKAPVIKRFVEGQVTDQLPVSYFKYHHNCIVLLDEAAASQLWDGCVAGRRNPEQWSGNW